MADWLKLKRIVDEAEEAGWTPRSWAAALDRLALSDLRALIETACREQALPDNPDAIETLGAVFLLGVSAIEGGLRHEFPQDLSELAGELGIAGLFVPESVQFLQSTIAHCSRSPKDGRLRQTAVDALLGSITPSNNGLQAVLMTAGMLMPLLGAPDRQRFIDAARSLPETLVRDPLVPSLELYHTRFTRGENALQTRGWTVSDPFSVITIHSHKGGVGKTTIAIALASRLAEEGRKVCLVDCDEQGPSLHYYLPVEPTSQKNVVFFSDWFCRRSSAKEETAQHSLPQGLVQPVAGSQGKISFVPGSFIGVDITRLDSVQHDLRTQGSEASRDKLRDLLCVLLSECGFDSVIVDTSPGVVHLSLDVLMACFSVRGSRIFVMRPRPVDIAQLCLEEDWVIKLQTRDSAHVVVINCVPPVEHAMAAIDYTNPASVASALRRWPQFQAYSGRLFQENFTDVLVAFANETWREYHTIRLDERESLRYAGVLSCESSDWGALSHRMDDHVRDAMTQILDRLCEPRRSTGRPDGQHQW